MLKSKGNELDIIFCSLPYSNLDHIYSAPAILKAVALSHGYTAKTFDFGTTLFNLCDRNVDLFNRIQNYFVTVGNTLNSQEQAVLESFYAHIIQTLKDNPSRYIGISVFSLHTHKATIDILSLIKQHNINGKVVIGGRGAKVPAYTVVAETLNLSSIDRHIGFGELVKKQGLVDRIIIGDGEDAVVELLATDVTQDSDDYKTETFNYPLPDYSDYNFKDYLWPGGEMMFPITGSKGCVRNCDFCDIRFQFGRYKYRTGTDIAREMIYIAETFGFRKFQFTDSLVNGGLKTLEEFCTIIAEYNSQHSDKISWNGQYICRPPEEMPSRLYKIMAASGAHGITIGAESGSNHVLDAMNKKTTVEALYYELEQFRQHGITCTLLTFVGHWEETHEDFVDHCRMLIKLLPYVKSGTISAIKLGDLAGILEGTPSIEYQQLLVSNFNTELIWLFRPNPTNTFKERVYRRLVVAMITHSLKIPTVDDFTVLNLVNTVVEQQHEKINEFYSSI